MIRVSSPCFETFRRDKDADFPRLYADDTRFAVMRAAPLFYTAVDAADAFCAMSRCFSFSLLIAAADTPRSFRAAARC